MVHTGTNVRKQMQRMEKQLDIVQSVMYFVNAGRMEGF